MTRIHDTPVNQRVPPYVPPPVDVTLADVGLACAGVSAGIKASGRPDVALFVAAHPVSVAGAFTTNAFAAAPVRLSRAHLARTGGRVRAIVINSGNANACTGERGERDALSMCERTAQLVGCSAEEVLVGSTGVIGVPLPWERVDAGIAEAHRALEISPAASDRALAAIMTTDAFEKRAGSRSDGHCIAGMAKGAGMIEPSMATMLALVATDAHVEPHELQRAIAEIASTSFNAVHVDSHTSTNDSFFLLATGTPRGGATASWERGARAIAERLAWLIARDGEGATKVTRIEVVGAPSSSVANDIARKVAHSALVRTALFGNDPNWGRFVSAVGNSAHVTDPSGVSCELQGVPVFSKGEPTVFDRAALVAALAKTDDVALVLTVGAGSGRAVVLTSDLGYRYIEVNAEYTT